MSEDNITSPNLSEADLESIAQELEKQAESEIAESGTKDLSVLEGELATLKDQWLRAMAETENLRRRAARDREEALKYASTNFGRDMLSIADNLRRALEAFPSVEELPESMKALFQGVELTESALLSAFERHGIKKVEPMGEKFDANLHQAMFEVEDQSVPAGVVVQVLQAGYLIHDRLLRPAMVGVSKGGQK
jgi:molecular chaperone GrpE